MSTMCNNALGLTPEQIEVIESSFELSLQVKLILEEVLRYDSCSCTAFIKEKLTRARSLSQDVNIFLDRLLIVIIVTEPTFLYTDYLLFAQFRIAAAINELAKLLTTDLCSKNTGCLDERLFELIFENIQIANSNLLAVLKFLAFD